MPRRLKFALEQKLSLLFGVFDVAGKYRRWPLAVLPMWSCNHLDRADVQYWTTWRHACGVHLVLFGWGPYVSSVNHSVCRAA